MSDSGTVAAPARQKAVIPLRKEEKAGASLDRKGGDRPFFSSSSSFLQEGDSSSPEIQSLFVPGHPGPMGKVFRRGKHDCDDELQRKCHECDVEEQVQRIEEVQHSKEAEEVHRKEEAHTEDVQRKCAECEAGEHVHRKEAEPKEELQRSAENGAKSQGPAGPGAAANTVAGAARTATASSVTASSGGSAALVQPRLTVGAPDDPYEREADKMGEKVMRMSYEAPAGAAAGINPGGSGVQRSEEEGMDEIQTKPVPGLQGTAQGGLQTSAGFSSRLQSSGGGSKMAAPVQNQMESAFQADFSAVKIHTGTEAASMSDEIGAQAFTYRNHVYFNDNKYDPDSSAGRFLLAHELTHTIQQGAAQTVRRDEGDAPPAPTEQESFLDKLKNGFDTVLSELLPDAIYNMYKAIRKDGIGGYIKTLLLGLFQGLFSKLGFSDKEILLIFEIFSQLKDQLPNILAALESGDCKPLFKALDLLSQVLSAIAGKVWDRLMEAIEPIRQWLIDIWETVLSLALDGVKAFVGDVWDEIKNFGSWIWQKFQPIIQKGKDAWAWVMKKLGFGDDPSEEGLLGFVSRKLGETWEAVKKLLKPVTDPIGKVLDGIKSIVSLDAIRKFQDDAKKWLDEVAKTATAMGNEDDAVKNKQLTLREVLLPALNKAIDRLKQTIRDASTWVLAQVTGIRDNVNGMVTGIQSNKYVSSLYSIVSWVPKTVDKIYDWASDKVDWIFGKIVDGVESLRKFIDPVLKGLEKIVEVASDLLGKLPDFVTGGLYGKIPKCIKDPIIDWITENILKNIPLISEMIDLKDKWPQIRATALTVLKQVFIDGKFAAALWTFFRNLLSLVGIDPTLVTTIIAKAAKNFSDIISKPGAFLKNVWGVIKGGFQLYWDNIGTHLLQGALDWLFGEVKGAVGVTPPKDFSLSSILGYILQLFGIDEENVFKRMAENPRIGKKKAAKLRQVWAAIKTAVEWIFVWLKEGPEGLLRKAKEKLSDLKNMVINGIISWVTEKVTAKILQKLATSSDPLGIGATINTLILIYDSIKTGIAYANRLLNIANQAMDNLAEIIAGNLGPASKAFEDLLGKATPVVLGFAVEVIIGPVGESIKAIVEGGRKAVDGAIDWLINGAMDIVGGLVDAVGKGVAAVKGWLGLTKEFKADNGEDHELSFKGTEQHATLMIASGNPVSYEVWIKGIKVPTPDSGGLAAKKQKALDKAKEISRVEGKAKTDKYTDEVKQKELRGLLDDLSALTGPLFKGLRPKSAGPQFGRLQSKSEWGTSMTVDGLTNVQRPSGSAPSVAGGFFDTINRRRIGGGSYYVRGHLLNEHLGGTGGDWENLTPITRNANSQHESIAEARVKNAAESGNIIKYEVVAEYGRKNNIKALENAVDAATNLREDPEAIKEVIRAEVFVPTRLVCMATMKNPSKNNEEATLVPKPTKIENVIDQTPGSYDLSGEKRGDVYLDSKKPAKIQEIDGRIDAAFAQKIIDAYKENGGRFSSGDRLVEFAVDGKAWFTDRRQDILRDVLKKPYVKLYHGS